MTATGSGVQTRQVKLRDSTLSGNPIDIESDRPPRLQSTTCDHSNWGVCALD